MNATTRSISVILFFLSAFLIACQSHEQKENDAFDEYKEEKMMAKDSVVIVKEVIQEPIKAEPVKVAENADDWTKFKNETEKKILANENKINKIKKSPEGELKFFKKIVHLEKENSDLKIQLKAYEVEMKVNLEKFKEQINLQEIEIDLKLKEMSKIEK